MTETVYINYCDVIDMARVRGLMALCTKLIGQKVKTIYFVISSPGGQVAAGIALYNFLKGLPVKVVMHNTSAIDSIASVIFMAGDERFACPNTTFLFHGVGINIAAGAELNLSRIQELASGLERDQEKIAGIIADNSGLKKEEIGGFFSRGESKDLKFALDKGLISEVRPLEIPEGTSVISIDTKPQAN